MFVYSLYEFTIIGSQLYKEQFPLICITCIMWNAKVCYVHTATFNNWTYKKIRHHGIKLCLKVFFGVKITFYFLIICFFGLVYSSTILVHILQKCSVNSKLSLPRVEFSTFSCRLHTSINFSIHKWPVQKYTQLVRLNRIAQPTYVNYFSKKFWIILFVNSIFMKCFIALR